MTIEQQSSSAPPHPILYWGALALTWLLIAALSLAEVFILYKIQGVPVSADRIIMFIAVPVILILLLVASLFRTHAFREMTVACLASVFAAMYAAQLYIYFVEKPGVFTNKTYDALLKLRAEGTDVYLAVYHTETTARDIGYPDKFILSGLPRTTSILCHEPPYTVVYETDRYGFNNPDAVWDAPKLDVVALGDSFVNGACVPNEHQLVNRMRDAIPLTLNLGIAGTGQLQQYANFREFGQDFKPDWIVWFYNEKSDLFNLVVELNEPALAGYLDPGYTQNAKANVSLFDQKLKNFTNRMLKERQNANKSTQEMLMDNLLMRDLREKFHLDFYRDYAKLDSKEEAIAYIPRLKQILAMTQESANAWGGRILFVYLPRKERWEQGENFNEVTFRPEVLDMVRGLGIEILDIKALLDQFDQPDLKFYMPTDAHFDVKGYNLVAEETVKYIREHGGP